MLHAWQRMIRLGRNFGIGVSLISQRPQDVNKKALNQTECLFCFQLTGPQERKAVADWVSDKGLREDLGKILPGLKQGRAHVWSPVWLDINREITIGTKTTFAAGSTPKVGQRMESKPLAPIEMEKLKQAMADTIERAKADDPRELRREIAKLRAEAKRVETRTVERQIIPDSQMKEFKVAVRLMEKQGQQRIETAQKLEASGRELIQKAGEFSAAMAKAAGDVPRAKQGNAGVQWYDQKIPTLKMGRMPQIAAIEADREHSKRDIPAGERKVLIACAQYPEGVDRSQLTILTGYKRSTRDAYIQRLRERGYVDVRSDLVLATQLGVYALGDKFEPLPLGDALREYWMNRLPEGERKILEELSKAYPNAMLRESLGDATGFKRSTRDAYIQRMIAKKIIIAPAFGYVQAAKELFGLVPA
jgi:hypothetical protein